MHVIGWVGFIWIVLSTLLSLNGFYVNEKHDYRALILSNSSARRSYVIQVLDIIAIAAITLSSHLNGAVILASIAASVSAPFFADIHQANKHILSRPKEHTETRVALLIIRIALVCIIAFV